MTSTESLRDSWHLRRPLLGGEAHQASRRREALLSVFFCVIMLGVSAPGCAVDAISEPSEAIGGAGQGGSNSQAGGAPGSVKEPTLVRFGTFNAKNLFNDRIDGESGVLGEKDSTPSSAEYQRKLRATAALLSQLDADVLILQEIENRAVLDDLAEQPALGGRYTARYLIPGNDPRGIDVGFLSSYPVLSQASHRDDRFARRDIEGGPKYRYARDCLEIHLSIAGRSIILLGVHFKAKSNDDPDKRLAEAQHTRFIADTLAANQPSAGVLILGDFNDFPGSAPMLAIRGAKGKPQYWSAGLQLPAEDAWTVESSSAPGGRALHDDLWANPLLAGYYQAGSARIIHDAQLEPELKAVSDHAPVVASYLIQPLWD